MRPAGMTRTERESRSKLKPMISWQEFLRATPNLRQQVCGSPGCKCQRGEKHTALVLTRRIRRRTSGSGSNAIATSETCWKRYPGSIGTA